MKSYSGKQFAGFLIPSVIGILLFMIPIQVKGSWTISVKVLADWIGSLLGGFLPLLCVLVVTVSAVMTLIGMIRPGIYRTHPLLESAFGASPTWTVVRVLGAVVAWIVYLGIGAGEDTSGLLHMISDPDSGGFVLNDLMTVLVIIFAIAGLLLPLLLDFGLLEFVGALLTRVMRPLFRIPGRAAVDCFTSWIGDGTLGVMLTCNQYEGGYYSAREASIIATTFSAVSITFSIVVLAQVGLMEYFGIYYLCICLIGVVCAVLLPRIPPLSRKKDTYLVEGKAMPEDIPEEYDSLTAYGLSLAMERVKEHRGLGQFLENGLKNAVGMWFGVLPVVMCIGTLALVLANNTMLFDLLGRPFLPVLQLLQVPEAAEASRTIIVGFVDMFTPSVIAAGTISSPMTRFIIAVFSVTQLIYLDEIGVLILGSKLPVRMWDLCVIFLERTVISLLIVCPVAHLIFG